MILIGIYRGSGTLDNMKNYIYTKPDPNAPLFTGDFLQLLGEVMPREDSPLIKDIKKLRKNSILSIGGGGKRQNKL